MDEVGLRNLVIDQNPDVAMSLFPHSYTQRAAVENRKKTVIKQWSIDETQSWFYSRSNSAEKTSTKPPGEPLGSSKTASPCKLTAERRRKFFQRRGPVSSMPQSPAIIRATTVRCCDSFENEPVHHESDSDPNSGTDSCECKIASLVRTCQDSKRRIGNTHSLSQDSGCISVSERSDLVASTTTVTKALEEVFKTTLFGWESVELLFDGSGLPYMPNSSNNTTATVKTTPTPKTTSCLSSSCLKSMSTSSSPKRKIKESSLTLLSSAATKLSGLSSPNHGKGKLDFKPCTDDILSGYYRYIVVVTIVSILWRPF